MNVLFVPLRASFLRWCSVSPRVPLQAHQAITPVLRAPPGICRETHPLPTEGLQALTQVGLRQTPVRAVTGKCCFLQDNPECPLGTEFLGITWYCSTSSFHSCFESSCLACEADCGATELSCREALASGRGDLQPCAVSQDVWGNRLGLLFYMTGDLMGFSPRSSHKSHIQTRP